jgi:hypothetical protein
MAKRREYKALTPELMKEVTIYIMDGLKEEEERLRKTSHDRKRANIKLALRKYRDILTHVEESVYEASQIAYDYELQELLGLMSGDRRDNFRVEAIKESAARSKVMIDHMNKMLESYKFSCENSNREEDRRRYRVLHSLYICIDPETPEEIAQREHVDKSTIYRDIDAAADRLAVLFFGVYGLKFL